MSFNKVILVGNLTETPELKVTTSGVPVVNFRIAVSRRNKKEGQQEADFFTVTAWNGTAEFISKYFTKGRSILVCGQLQSRTWTDANEQKRYVVEVLANEVSFVDKKTDGQNTEAYTTQNAAVIPTQNPSPNFEELSTEDDLPF